ncbi:fimbrial protein [Enterobacter sp. 638]|uniref:Fimbrial-type adhesion domain-containing protein n=1 Tax=Enterobacter sp. (strain 638) TaxID=399742 RepID=A0A9J9KWR1_ENT38|nr:fimbrial protein [Enterobacter sp. 638]ABP58767.1 hypothetical protein Ent638_0077 [Enterobacter sp. 638]
MKKILLAMTVASLCMANSVQAQDNSATLDINGTVNGISSGCIVNITGLYGHTGVVKLEGVIESLPTQGQKATHPTEVTYSVGGCSSPIALQLRGTADDADGTTLANVHTDDTVASGVGIGLFDSNNAPLSINSSLMTLDESNSGSFSLQLVKLRNQTQVVGSVAASLTIDIVRL